MKNKVRLFAGIIILLTVLGIISISHSGSAPHLMTYQGYLHDKTTGNPFNGDISITFNFYDSDTAGNLLLSVGKQVEVRNGVYNIIIDNPGMGFNPPIPMMSLLFQKHSQVWLGIQVGFDAEMAPRIQMTSVPYALSVDAHFLGDFVGDPDWDKDGYQKNDSPPDCNDGNAKIYPGAIETCNYLDDNCDGTVDESFVDENGEYKTDFACGRCGDDCTLLVLNGLPGVCNTNFDTPVCSVACSGNCFDANANPTDGCECCDPLPFDCGNPGNGIDDDCDGVSDEDDC